MANAMIYAERCWSAQARAEVDTLLAEIGVTMSEISRDALFLAAKVHLGYRHRGGSRTTGLPDFFIGAHAQTLGIPILTRDKGRYETYFPSVTLISP